MLQDLTASAVDIVASELLPKVRQFKKCISLGIHRGIGLISKSMNSMISLNKKIELARDLGLRLGVVTQLCSSASTAINWALSYYRAI